MISNAHKRDGRRTTRIQCYFDNGFMKLIVDLQWERQLITGINYRFRGDTVSITTLFITPQKT